jgi:hypothetical protein
LDPILITGIRYSADLQRAYAESQVFKFADRPGVWFFCQIQVREQEEASYQINSSLLSSFEDVHEKGWNVRWGDTAELCNNRNNQAQE